MDQDNERLSRIVTLWTKVRQAHDSGDSRVSREAQRVLMERYCTAVHRYLLGALRDEEAADELFQEFAVRFLNGDFRRADASRGRFRDYVRTVLIHLVTDRHRALQRNGRSLPPDVAAPASSETSDVHDEKTFIDSWRVELMNHAWAALQTAQPAQYKVLLFHVNNPDVESTQAAKDLSAQLGRTITATNARVTLHRARAKFAQLLLEEVARSLGEASHDELMDELKVLGLEKICRPALEKAAGD
jgi:RNA polymerase sigma-70 factor (ECF subfamily)